MLRVEEVATALETIFADAAADWVPDAT